MMLVHERMHFLRRICIWALPALPVAWLTAVWLAPWRLEPLSSSNTEGTGKLPPDAIVVHAEATTPCTAPMVLREAALTSLGTALTIPDGKGGGAGRGQATLSCTVDQPGNYRAWVRARWQDSCGNSVFFRVGDGRQRTIGQDSVYGRWHWVEAGNHELPPGAHKLAFVEREDGIAIDQVLLTRDKTFVPTGAISAGTEAIGTRIFADDFSRSPGHGLEAWRMPSGLWDIAFSLDPNRIPNQYSLVGRAPIGDSAPTAIALVSGAPWNGCRLAFSVRPELGSEFGAVLEHSGDGGDALRIGFALSGSTPSAQLTRPGLSVEAALHDALRPDQWHRVVAERWSSVLRVTLDGDIVFERTDIAPGNGDVGVWVAAGSVAFDDVHIEEIPWQEDDGKSQRLNWDVPAGARWYRPRRDGPVALVGRKGRLRTAATELPVYAVLVDDRGTDSCRLVTEGYVPLARSGGARLFRWADADSLPPAAVTLEPSGRSTEIARVAIRYGVPTAPVFRLGPYNFETDKIEDPSDYLDFTPEEYRRIAASPEADKLRRQRKYNALVGTDSSAVWRTRAGRWAVAGGVLRGSGPNARLAFWQEIAGDFDLLLRFRVADPGTIADLDLYGGPPDGLRVRIAVTEPPGDTVDSAVAVLAPRPNEWQSLIVRTRGGVARARIGEGVWRQAVAPRAGDGAVLIGVPRGQIEMDDIEFRMLRHQDGGAFYGFDRRECDWWRTGESWVDHGGIACVLASQWISLDAPASHATLWNKRTFQPDLIVALTVEENTEWFGWGANPSHTHHPADNICLHLATAHDVESGYRLEVNAENRTATVLYRDGKRVASARQDPSFPLRYVGGHAPYSPRRSRISLTKSGGTLHASVNGRPVLDYTDPEPVPVSRVGIGGYDTHVNFTNIEIRELPADPKTLPEAAGAEGRS